MAPIEVGRNILKRYLYLNIENYFRNNPGSKVSIALRLVMILIYKSNHELFERNSKIFG